MHVRRLARGDAVTPADVRLTIAAARRCPRMYGETPSHVETFLMGVLCGAASLSVDVRAAWCEAYARGLAPLTDDDACNTADAVANALWPQETTR